MMAARLPGLLPPLTPRELLETSMVWSVAGLIERGALTRDRPFRSPHHSRRPSIPSGRRLRPARSWSRGPTPMSAIRPVSS